MKRCPVSRVVMPVAIAFALSFATEAGALTTRVSVATDGTQGTGGSVGSWTTPGAVTPNGRFVGFWSEFNNLVPGDTNGVGDVFVRDRVTGTTTRVSVGAGGVQADSLVSGGYLSDDGRYVLMQSGATNLISSPAGAFV